MSGSNGRGAKPMTASGQPRLRTKVRAGWEWQFSSSSDLAIGLAEGACAAMGGTSDTLWGGWAGYPGTDTVYCRG